MNIRESMEQREQKMLSPYAALSLCSRGRERQEEECDVRTVYQRDRDRILHSKAFRRMKDKTQVFVAPQGDHYRTRLTHTLEVSQIARTIAKALRLNEDLVEAIALGHDLGHTPFGHAGDGNLHIYECSNDLTEEEFKKRVDKFFDLIYKEACAQGGLVSGEHGIGSGKIQYLVESIGETNMALMEGIKRVFDPKMILNPGKVCYRL